MYTKAAESFFGGRRIHVARALEPQWSLSAVYLWEDIVPLAAARKLAELSGGKLPVIDELYDDHGNIIKKKQKRRA